MVMVLWRVEAPQVTEVLCRQVQLADVYSPTLTFKVHEAVTKPDLTSGWTSSLLLWIFTEKGFHRGRIFLSACSKLAVCNFGNFGSFWYILSPFGYLVLMADFCLSRQRSHFISKSSKAQGFRELSAFALKVTASTTTTRLDLMLWPNNCNLSLNCVKLLPSCQLSINYSHGSWRPV